TLTESAADAYNICPLEKPIQLFFVIPAVTGYDRLGEKLLKYSAVLLRRIDLHQSCSHGIRCAGRQKSCSCHTVASGDHKDSAIGSFMGIVFSRRKKLSQFTLFISKADFSPPVKY